LRAPLRDLVDFFTTLRVALFFPLRAPVRDFAIIDNLLSDGRLWIDGCFTSAPQ
jgi:hypothetical protein